MIAGGARRDATLGGRSGDPTVRGAPTSADGGRTRPGCASRRRGALPGKVRLLTDGAAEGSGPGRGRPLLPGHVAGGDGGWAPSSAWTEGEGRRPHQALPPRRVSALGAGRARPSGTAGAGPCGARLQRGGVLGRMPPDQLLPREPSGLGTVEPFTVSSLRQRHGSFCTVLAWRVWPSAKSRLVRLSQASLDEVSVTTASLPAIVASP